MSAWAPTGWRPSEPRPRMSRTLAVVLGVGAGCLVGMQAPINSRLGKAVGTAQAATFSFLVGTVALVALASVWRGGLGNLAHVSRAPWWALVGGLLGAVYVSVALVAVRTLGASGLTAVVITGQLAISVVIDRFGLLGVARQQIGPARIIGLAVIVVDDVVSARRAPRERRDGRARGVVDVYERPHAGAAPDNRQPPSGDAFAQRAVARDRAPRPVEVAVAQHVTARAKHRLLELG